MKLFSIQILRHDGVASDPQTPSTSFALSSIGYFQRTAVRELISFVAKTVTQRTSCGQRASIEHEGYFCHVYVRPDGLTGAVVVDSEYKARVAFTLLNKLLDDYDRDVRGVWTSATMTQAWPPLEAAIVAYQDPTKADALSAIEKELDETKDVLAKALETLLTRGEKLDELVAKSSELSTQSKVFYQQARRTNSCCIVM